MKFNIGTFNARGLSQEYKQEQLSRNIGRYNLDICSIQQTKIDSSVDKPIGKNRLICFLSDNRHYGNGFIVSNKWKDNVNRYWKVSDRICVLELTTEKSKKRENGVVKYRSEFIDKNRIKITKDSEADHTIIIINVYAPTSSVAKTNKTELKTFIQTTQRAAKKTPKAVYQNHNHNRRF